MTSLSIKRAPGFVLGLLTFAFVAASCGSDEDDNEGFTSDGRPLEACDTSGDCTIPTPYCVEGFCNECLGDDNCGGEQQFCHPSTNECVECTGSENCDGDEPYCNDVGDCVECVDDGNCGAGQVCDPMSDDCRSSCATDADCPTDVGRPYCNADRDVCVECVGDGNCSSDEPFCDDAGRCQECRTDANCAGTEDPICDPQTGNCVECLLNAHCETGEVCQFNLECSGF